MDNEQPSAYGKYVAGLVFVAVVVIGAGAYLYYSGYRLTENTQEPIGLAINNAVRLGNEEEALAAREKLMQDPGTTDNQKAVATFATLNAEFRVTGDRQSFINDIADMKKLFLDESRPLWLRVSTLNVLAMQFYISGRDPVIFEEVFKDQPFAQYRVEGDPDQSSRKLSEWSLTLLPTSGAAINLARWYSEQILLNPELPPTAVRDNAVRAQRYLNQAETLARDEASRDLNYESSTRYLTFRYWQAVIVGRLASSLGEPYINTFDQTYRDFIAFAEAQDNVLARDFLLYARLFYAQRLALTGGSLSDAKAQLDILAGQMSRLHSVPSNRFILFLKSEYLNRREAAPWQLIEEMTLVSPAFKEQIDIVTRSVDV